ncbi:PBSX family phage terminase large subunit [Liquorilactobacillus satsumensis]|uniref:PBSX family phage terminase large subunit n=1 Tax=Liquorilactobacillus satsumensis TaxID=259059 RepID=UPI0021C2F171|nr:PBSX family phage terminase large subunit [Liquorilactobacillus satsumensis]MCP9357382.1 PBSX family phage terminase large subunit [Liquorilactobacillus satsumensis]MCP9372058.1 PBSX family phage terminase large subunit [Liquorilactobacillus satsumensis]
MLTTIVDDTKTKPKVIKISQMVNPHFYKLWNTDKPYIIANGGRGSFKSSVISFKLAIMMKKWTQLGKKVNVICIRENKTNLHDSVYNQIQWALDMLNIADEYQTRKSPMMIVHKRTGSTFYFYGADDPMKLKSNIVGNVIATWFEEAANMKSAEVFDQSIPSFIRQKPDFVEQSKVFWSYNPPRNKYDWVNEWITKCENDPDYFVDTSTYLDDELGFTTEQQLRLINTIKKNDPEYYRWLYLGEVIGLGTNVYNADLFKRVEEIPNDDHVGSLYFSADTGHAVSATTVGAYALMSKRDKNGKPRVLLLDNFYYSPEGKSHKKSPSELSKDVKEFIDMIESKYHITAHKYIMDSAEAALRNQMYNDYDIRWTPVKKLKKPHMIEYVQSLLARGSFYYLPTSNNVGYFIPQHQKYQWDEKTMQSDEPKVIKVEDHCCDQAQYFAITARRELQLQY